MLVWGNLERIEISNLYSRQLPSVSKGGDVVLEGLALCIYLKDSMPPEKIDVPAKGVDGAIWLRH